MVGCAYTLIYQNPPMMFLPHKLCSGSLTRSAKYSDIDEHDMGVCTFSLLMLYRKRITADNGKITKSFIGGHPLSLLVPDFPTPRLTFLITWKRKRDDSYA